MKTIVLRNRKERFHRKIKLKFSSLYEATFIKMWSKIKKLLVLGLELSFL